MNYDQILQEIYQEIQSYAGQGEPAAYIPDLLKVNPDRYGICLHTLDGQDFAMGDCDERFAIQSISHPEYLESLCTGHGICPAERPSLATHRRGAFG